MTTTGLGAASLPVTLADVESARELLVDVVRNTPLEPNRALSELVGGPVFLKCENLQRAGSFKIRGAYTRISRLTPEQRALGVVAASAGNHAQGVALAAQLIGTRTKVYMPSNAPLPKVQATRAYGAEVEFVHGTRRRLPRARPGLGGGDRRGPDPPVRPRRHRGRARAPSAWRSSSSVPDVATVLVCTGGGGLLAGVAAAVRGLKPEVSVIGVQAEGAAAYPLVAVRRAAGAARHDDHHGRRDRGRAAPARFRSRSSRPSSTGSSPSARS